MLCRAFVYMAVVVGSCVGRPDGVKGCGTPEASFIPIHGNSSLNESLPVYIRALRNDTDWSVLIWTEGVSYKGFYLRVFSTTTGEAVRGSFVKVPLGARACSAMDACHTSSFINRTLEKFNWQSDPSYHGNVYFRATIVISYKDGYKILSTEMDEITQEKGNGTTELQEVYKKCGVSVGCLSQCNPAFCSHLITWEKHGQFVRFQFLAVVNQLNLGGSFYQSLAFSEDKFMGEDDAMTCKVYKSVVSLEVGFNIAGQKNYQQIHEGYFDDLMVKNTSLVDGVSKCVVDRKIESDTLFKLSRKWHLLHAIGVVSENSLQYHTERSVSTEMVDLQSNAIVAEEPPSRLLLTLHGVFMALAWMVFAPVGLLSAKFCRNNTKVICGQQLWFQIHRTCMILASTLTVTAVVVIVADVKRPSSVNISVDYRNIHPVLGFTVLCLCISNALISLCRCSPTDKKRSIFNQVHRFCGLSACILAGINMAVGTSLERSLLPMDAGYVVYAYFGLLLLCEVIHQVVHCRRECQDKDSRWTPVKENKTKVSMERIFLFTTILLWMAFCSVIVYFLVNAQ